MIVGTTAAAKILNISTSRLRYLLISNRVEGAYKTGRMWLIPVGERSLAPDGDAGSHLSLTVNLLLLEAKEALDLDGVTPESPLKELFTLILKKLEPIINTIVKIP